VVEDHAASARRTLIDCSDEVGHGLNTIPWAFVMKHDPNAAGP
jgi:hypothetical protein